MNEKVRLTSTRSKMTIHNDFISVIARQKLEQSKVNTFDPASLNEVDTQTSFHSLRYFEQGSESAILDSGSL